MRISKGASLLLVAAVVTATGDVLALELCAKAVRGTNDLREGSPLKLRSVCKDGREVSVGTTDDLQGIQDKVDQASVEAALAGKADSLDVEANTQLLGCVTDPQGGAGCFVDAGDGTITDLRTRLMWELKTDDGGVHDIDNKYTWTVFANMPNGTLFTDFLPTLNDSGTGCFAGQCDWRLPTPSELQSLLRPWFADCTSELCSTLPGEEALIPLDEVRYWTAAEVPNSFGQFVWSINFNLLDATSRQIEKASKGNPLYARAVRTIP